MERNTAGPGATCFTSTKLLVLLVQKVQILTPEELQITVNAESQDMHVDGAQAGATAAAATPAASSTSAPSLAGAVADACARSNGSEVIALTEYTCIPRTNVQILTLSRISAREATERASNKDRSKASSKASNKARSKTSKQRQRGKQRQRRHSPPFSLHY